jgi:hypothetical protein
VVCVSGTPRLQKSRDGDCYNNRFSAWLGRTEIELDTILEDVSADNLFSQNDRVAILQPTLHPSMPSPTPASTDESVTDQL